MKTTFSSPSCMYQQMLSCVWHGVCRASTEIPSPILKVSPWAGVRVTASQSLPPMMGRPGNCESYEGPGQLYGSGDGVHHGALQETNDLAVTTSMIPMA